MRNFFQKLWIALTAIFRLHLGINNIVAFAILAITIDHFTRDPLVQIAEVLFGFFDSTKVSHVLIIGVISGIMAAILFGLAGYFLFNWYNKTRLMGDYIAYEVKDDDTTIDWGKVTIRFYPLSSSTGQTPVKMRLTVEDVILDGDGLIIDNRYLVGCYTETGHPERRRSGSFTYQLDGAGKKWEGTFVAIDPDNSEPRTGRGRWIRC